ncbi:MAG: hypothetical protein ACFFBZ_16200 [Promethearchaeota archaeon]
MREGEYQFSLAKIIASFQLKLHFPNVKEIINELYGEEKADDIQLIRKIQTILKKMEKSSVVKILPKKTPWALQRYALLSFKFQDSDKNSLDFATDQQIEQAQNLLNTELRQVEKPLVRQRIINAEIFVLTVAIIASYAAILWEFTQPIANPIISILAFSIATVCSLILGKILARK